MPTVIESTGNVFCSPQPGMNNTKVDVYNPKVWGPACWQFIHIATVCYPKNPSVEHMEGMKNWILSLAYVLPCESCRGECHKYVQNAYHHGLVDVAVLNPDNLFKFFCDFHNAVNKRNGSKLYAPVDAKGLYERRYVCEDSIWCPWNIVKIVLVICIIFLFYKFIRKT